MTATPRPTAAARDRLRRRLARSQPNCHICGHPIDYTLKHPHPQSYQLDHLVPLNRGGAHTIENAAASHAACNRAKSDKAHAPIVRRSRSLS